MKKHAGAPFTLNTLITLSALSALSLAYAPSARAEAENCPAPQTLDARYRLCVVGQSAIGPFPWAMKETCKTAGGGASCDGTSWGLDFARRIRGTGRCAPGTAWDESAAACVEGDLGFGPFTPTQRAHCTKFYSASVCNGNQIPVAALPKNPVVSKSKVGAWLWFIEQTGLTHVQLADRLKGLGIGRIYIKINDGAGSCAAWPELCDASLAAIYKSRGIEPWAWSYNYPGNVTAQAVSIQRAIENGYAGYVLDLETEFNGDGRAGDLAALLTAFAKTRTSTLQRLKREGSHFPMHVTTWGNPADQGMRVDVIDRYVDAHMPQTYIEAWKGTYLSNPEASVKAATCEYRRMGAKKPIHHIVNTEEGIIQAGTVNRFLKVGGAQASVWRIPGVESPAAIWPTWRAVDWKVVPTIDESCR